MTPKVFVFTAEHGGLHSQGWSSQWREWEQFPARIVGVLFGAVFRSLMVFRKYRMAASSELEALTCRNLRQFSIRAT